MLSSATKKQPSKKRIAFSQVDRNELASKLRVWALEEMGFRPQGRHVNSRIPDVEDFKMLCRGSMMDIWSHVLQHVRSAQKPITKQVHIRTVQKVRGNLKLKPITKRVHIRLAMLEKKKMPSEDALQENGNKHEVVKNTELKSQIMQVGKDISHLEKEILRAEKSLDQIKNEASDVEKRCALLSSFSDRCLKKAKVFDEFRRRFEGRIVHYKDKRSMSENLYFVQKPSLTGVMRTNDQSGSVGLESACTRNVRETCEAIGSFLHHLHNAFMTEENPTRPYNDKTKAQLWTSVENMLSQHPASEIYASLTRTALDSAGNLQELTSRIDVRKEAEELKFKYENSGHFLDASSPRPLLQSVRQLIEEGQSSHFQRFLETKKAKNEMCKGRKILEELQDNMETKLKAVYGDNVETISLIRSLYCTELECVVAKATLGYLEKETKELEKIRLIKQAQVDTLYAKYKQIQDFEKVVQAKQSIIRVLIKHNSDAKNKLDQQQKEIIKYMQDRVCTHEAPIEALSNTLCDSVSKEVTSFIALPLHRILFSTVEGYIIIENIEHGMENGWDDVDNPLYLAKQFNNYLFLDSKALDCLLVKVMETQDEVITVEESIKLKKYTLEWLRDMTGQSTDDNHVDIVKETVEEHERLESQQVLPKVQESFSKATKALSECILTKDAVISWWEQPAQYITPWAAVDGMNMRQWKDQWTIMATRLRQSQMQQ